MGRPLQVFPVAQIGRTLITISLATCSVATVIQTPWRSMSAGASRSINLLHYT